MCKCLFSRLFPLLVMCPDFGFFPPVWYVDGASPDHENSFFSFWKRFGSAISAITVDAETSPTPGTLLILSTSFLSTIVAIFAFSCLIYSSSLLMLSKHIFSSIMSASLKVPRMDFFTSSFFCLKPLGAVLLYDFIYAFPLH